MPPFAQANPVLHQIFLWSGPPGEQRGHRTFYEQFTLNNIQYKLGDCVYLYPEDEALPHYIGKIKSAFVDSNYASQDPHCIEVLWFERRVNLETSTRGLEESEREVFELGDTDVNPIGCISGKCSIIKARTYEEAMSTALMHARQEEWYFCRGYFLQQQNTFQPYNATELVNPEAQVVQPQLPSRVSSHLMHQNNKDPLSNMASLSDDGDPDFSLTGHPNGRIGGSAFVATHPVLHQSDRAHSQEGDGGSGGGSDSKAAIAAAARKKVSGRVCAECSATTTPQWREGPAGPKTLCNACGVRYVRSQQRAGKKAGGTAISKRDAVALSGDRASNKGGLKTSPPNKVDDAGYAGSMSKGQQQDMNNGGSSRPVRQAAKVSANRTAAFARTGDFSTEDEEEVDEEGGYAAAATNRRKRSTNAVPALQAQRAGAPGIKTAASGEDNTLPFHHNSDSTQQQPLPISALSLPASNPYPASVPRQSPPPLSALPTHLDQQDFGYSHTIPPISGSTHQLHISYPHATYPNIVPIPDYLMSFTTQAIPASDDPYAQPLQLQPKQEHPLVPLHNSTGISHPVASKHNIMKEDQQSQQSQYVSTGQQVLHTSLQQQQRFGVTHQQPYHMQFSNPPHGMDGFSTGLLLQQQIASSLAPESDPMSFLFQPMFPSTSLATASALGSYPTTAMPAFSNAAPSAFSSVSQGIMEGLAGAQPERFPHSSQAAPQQQRQTEPSHDSHLFTQQSPLLHQQRETSQPQPSTQTTLAPTKATLEPTPHPSLLGDSYHQPFPDPTTMVPKHSHEGAHNGTSSNNLTGVGNGGGPLVIPPLIPSGGQ